MTPAPASPPDQLADAEGELPAEITAAIEACRCGLRYSKDVEQEMGAARSVLASAILARLTAAEAERDAAIRERDEARATTRDLHRRTQKAERFRERHKSWNDSINKRIREQRLRMAAERDLAAALARAERAEKALEPPPGWALVPLPGTKVSATHPQTVLNPDKVFEVLEVESIHGHIHVRGEQTCWFGLGLIRPALSHPAPAVET
jgi:hypothetical protein